MRRHTFSALALVAFTTAILAAPAPAADAVCVDSIAIDTADGTLTAQLVGEESVSGVIYAPVLFPLPGLAPIRTALGTYQFADGRRVTIGCLSLAD